MQTTQSNGGRTWIVVALVGLCLWLGAGQTALAVTATGGTETETNGYRIHTFTTVGTTSLNVTVGGFVDVLVVAGGGGGGAAYGGGGGGGGLIYSNALLVSPGTNWVIVGGGGTGGPAGAAAANWGGNGTNSVFSNGVSFALVALGGGGGGGYLLANGKDGGSGGGGAYGGAGGNFTNGQGCTGGTGYAASQCYGGGGGGGAGTQGSNGTSSVGGNGGAGVSNAISGSWVTYAGGGGGGTWHSGNGGIGGAGGGGSGGTGTANTPGGNGTNGLGGGGGGSGWLSSPVAGGNGGSGIVVVRYALSYDLPQIFNIRSQNQTATSADLVGQLTDIGGPAATVDLYWSTTDGGTNASTWTTGGGSVSNLGSYTTAATFTNTLVGLTSNRVYYYRYAASNSNGVAWDQGTASFLAGEVSVTKIADASEIGPATGTFRIQRDSSATNGPITVNFAISGTATAGAHYVNNLGTSATLTNGGASVDVVVTPINYWADQNDRTVSLTITPGPYVIGTSSNAGMTIANAPLPPSPTNTWIAAAPGNASTPGNWSLGHAPTATETVLLGVYSVKDMTWDAAAGSNVAAWLQTAAYNGTVTVATVYQGKGPFTNFTVTGDAAILGGAWTHGANSSAELNRLRVTVGGNLLVGNATITADDAGYYTGYQGPGGRSRYAAAHGGMATYDNDATSINSNTYGYVIAPTNLGSSGFNGNGVANGGGAILLTIAGTTTVQSAGSISANSRATDGSAGGSGGSIYLSTGRLTGGGTIAANGGTSLSYAGGAGGRVAIVLTDSGADFSSWTGTNSAYGGSGVAGKQAAAGTVYRQIYGVAAGAGTVLVDNKTLATNLSFTALPAFSNTTENISKTVWVVTNKTRLGLVANVTVYSLNLSHTNSYLELAGYTGTVSTLTITNGSFRPGTYAAADLGPLVTDSSPGATGRMVVLGEFNGTVFKFR